MKNDPSLSPLFDEFVKTLPPYDDPRDAEISALRQQLAELERERDELVKTYGLQDITNEDCGIPLDDEELYARA